MNRHPRRARLLAGDERALRHAEGCERCADLLLAEDEDRSIGNLLRDLLAPPAGFGDRASSVAHERIRLQDLWDLLGDTAGGVVDAVRILADVPEGESPTRHEEN